MQDGRFFIPVLACLVLFVVANGLVAFVIPLKLLAGVAASARRQSRQHRWIKKRPHVTAFQVPVHP